MPYDQVVCPRCRGFRRIGVSPDDPDARLCDLCRGSGWLDPDQVPRASDRPELFGAGEAWALTRIGVRNIFTAIFWLVIVALPIATFVIVVTWWSAWATDPIRSVLELLPSSIVADTAADRGEPWAVAGAVLLATVIAGFVVSRARRQALRRTIKPGLDAYGCGLLRAVILVGGVGLAGTAGPIADGSDLRTEDPNVFTSPGHIAFVIVLVIAFAFFGTRRLAVQLFAADHPELVANAAAQPTTVPGAPAPPVSYQPSSEYPPPPPPPPPGERPPTFIDPDTGDVTNPFGT